MRCTSITHEGSAAVGARYDAAHHAMDLVFNMIAVMLRDLAMENRLSAWCAKAEEGTVGHKPQPSERSRSLLCMGSVEPLQPLPRGMRGDTVAGLYTAMATTPVASGQTTGGLTQVGGSIVAPYAQWHLPPRATHRHQQQRRHCFARHS